MVFHKSSDVRKIAISYYLENKVTQSQVAILFKIAERTFRYWLEQYYKYKTFSRSTRDTKSYKIKQKHVDYILKVIKSNPTWSITMIRSNVLKKFNDFNISQSHLSKVIRDNNITRKRTRIRHFPKTRYGKPIDFKKEMKIFYVKIDKFSIHKIISIDETSINAEITHNYSRCELGKRCVKRTTDNRVFKKFTLVCAISSKGIIGWTLYENGGMTSERMVVFINKFIKNKFTKNLIIMDNGGAHKSNLVKNAINNTNNTLLYSVPYRPKTNAIESWFNQFKHYFKYDSSVYEFSKLKRNVKKSFNLIPKNSYKNYMVYAYKNTKHRKMTNNISNRRRPLKKYKN